MQKNLMGFLLKLIFYTIALLLVYFFIHKLIPEKFYFENAVYLFGFFFIITLVFHAGLLSSSAKSNRSFVSYYMFATAMKLLLFIAVIILYALFHRDRIIAFVSNFFILYLLFTIFEVSLVYRTFSGNNFPAESPPKEDSSK